MADELEPFLRLTNQRCWFIRAKALLGFFFYHITALLKQTCSQPPTYNVVGHLQIWSVSPSKIQIHISQTSPLFGSLNFQDHFG